MNSIFAEIASLRGRVLQQSESHWWIMSDSSVLTLLRPPSYVAVYQKWTDSFEKKEEEEEEVWSLSTSRPLMKMDVRTQCPP